ncbi:hypothetical protein DAQ1742_03879 [Dickeya aquatica]|uniref:Uncharacterized protein n=1 Tax=Dickeya aquatica TaxID=1401087 RepID=A0A375AF96_9GAMM|nr:hypothetical protein DAQ1742_03879 [Dickeya aquatica]
MKISHRSGRLKSGAQATKGMNRGLTLPVVQGIIRRFPLF